eukprot:TRINITY_DN62839_c0_g1_i3.p1 TRINITY_DN62839_c0_g1~~TRINITY_DN62839_c0_g1_i3.p1  ORF type:complete len:346 (-),score=48.13 TRINITY_DN62839_c0_g1_i3:749-1786(-)
MDVTFSSFPADDVDADPEAYRTAIKSMKKGDVVIVFTPDDTHFDISKAALEHGLHVLCTKPVVQTLEKHLELVKVATANNALLAVEVHKRFDPIYADAVERIQGLGDLNYFVSYMSQPKQQLSTFVKWAGKSSDISYYLNSHHIDFLCHAMQGRAKPTKVVGMASTGVATGAPYNIEGAEDTITLTVQWESLQNPNNKGTSVHTASWAASAKAEVHSQQRFFFLGSKGEVNVDQAHRGYEFRSDEAGYKSMNPLFMKYSKSPDGYFDGQNGYGYISFDKFVDACLAIGAGNTKPTDYNNMLATVDAASTITSTAILEAGWRSTRNQSLPVEICYSEGGHIPTSLK